MKRKLLKQLKSIARTFCHSLLLAFVMVLCGQKPAFALTGNPGVHDPSGIIKCNGKYYVFTTGGGVGVKSSTDLINWVQEKSAFGSYIPSWVKSYVDFDGNYWAPNCIFMNNRYYLYYSCAQWGTPNCVIGVASNPTLDPNASNYKWTDLGMVAKASSSKDLDAIDAYTFRDTNKKVYVTYGGYNGGNGVGEVDTITGKFKNGVKKIAAKGEGTSMWKNGNYYYFFEQHGSCCSGTSSTYYISCGRSTNPLGPYVDANGTSLITSYGVDVVKKNGKYIGPGHSGFFTENGVTYASYHYYDGNNGGSPTLGIGRLIFVNGWPKITNDWLDNGNYSIVGSASVKSLSVNGSVIELANQSKTDQTQKWAFTAQGTGLGIYTITNSNKSMDVAGCANTNGAKVQMGTSSSSSNCQKYFIERGATGYVLSPVNTIKESTKAAKFVTVAGNSTAVGAQLELRDHNGNNAQKWIIRPFGDIIADLEETEVLATSGTQGLCYPNPFVDEFVISHTDEFEYTLYNMTGMSVEEGKGNGSARAGANLSSGMYVLRVRSQSGDRVFKINKR